MPDLTTEEKIDYIYESIKKEKRNQAFRISFKLLFYGLIVAYSLYFYYVGFAKLKAEIIESVKPDISSEKIMDGLKGQSVNLLETAKSLYRERSGNSLDSTSHDEVSTY